MQIKIYLHTRPWNSVQLLKKELPLSLIKKQFLHLPIPVIQNIIQKSLNVPLNHNVVVNVPLPTFTSYNLHFECSFLEYNVVTLWHFYHKCWSVESKSLLFQVGLWCQDLHQKYCLKPGMVTLNVGLKTLSSDGDVECEVFFVLEF